MTDFGDVIGDRRFVAILRGCPADKALAIAEAVWDNKFGLVEIPIQDEAAVQILAEVARAGAASGERVGAGTVVSTRQVSAAIEAGAAFTIAPGFDPEILEASHRAGIPHLPGVATATDIQTAMRAGCHWLKAFPAGSLGPAWLREMKGPFPGACFVATGGINASNAAEFIASGARALGIGAAITRDGGLSEILGALP